MLYCFAMDQTATDKEELISPRTKAVSPQRAAVERCILGAVERRFQKTSWQKCRYTGAYLGLAFFHLGKKRREMAIANVQLALGVNRVQAARIARRSAQNWGITMCEFLHQSVASEQDIRDYVSLEGEEHLQAALAEGKGVILLGSHMGNWELFGARVVLDYPLSPVVRPLSNGSIQAQILRIRSGMGLNVIDKYGSGRPILKTLRKNEPVMMVADRHAGAVGTLLPLFGHHTQFETGPARMALMSGAPIIPIIGARRGPWLSDGRIRGRFLPAFRLEPTSRENREAAVVEGTRQVIASLETLVREYPDQWTWMIRRWRENDMRRAQTEAESLA
jgi:Kdo2-lipid IVA lauroyltransferase/acyltransferase